MARATKAQKIENENEQAALQFFERMLAGLTDPRRPQGLRYPLRSVAVIALMSMVCRIKQHYCLSKSGSPRILG